MASSVCELTRTLICFGRSQQLWPAYFDTNETRVLTVSPALSVTVRNHAVESAGGASARITAPFMVAGKVCHGRLLIGPLSLVACSAASRNPTLFLQISCNEPFSRLGSLKTGSGAVPRR